MVKRGLNEFSAESFFECATNHSRHSATNGIPLDPAWLLEGRLQYFPSPLRRCFTHKLVGRLAKLHKLTHRKAIANGEKESFLCRDTSHACIFVLQMKSTQNARYSKGNYYIIIWRFATLPILLIMETGKKNIGSRQGLEDNENRNVTIPALLSLVEKHLKLYENMENYIELSSEKKKNGLFFETAYFFCE